MGVIKVHGLTQSRFSQRVEIALKIKGVEYELVEEDLVNKSHEVIKYNPIHKKIPILVHDGKPIVESLIILEYIDETFDGTPLLPTHPYERSQARFWARFIDDKVIPRVWGMLRSKGEEAKEEEKEAHELLNLLEKEINGKKFFGGNTFGYVDLAGLPVAYWMPIVQEAAGKEVLLTKDKFPALFAWSENLLTCDVFKQNLPERDGLLAFFKRKLMIQNN